MVAILEIKKPCLYARLFYAEFYTDFALIQGIYKPKKPHYLYHV